MDKRHRNVMTILALGNCTRSLRRFVIKCLGDDTDELVSDVVGEEVTEVHDGSVILKAEPWLLFALAFTSDVAMITSWNLLTRTEVLPKAIFEEGLA